MAFTKQTQAGTTGSKRETRNKGRSLEEIIGDINATIEDLKTTLACKSNSPDNSSTKVRV
jgi:hypothetical protein